MAWRAFSVTRGGVPGKKPSAALINATGQRTPRSSRAAYTRLSSFYQGLAPHLSESNVE